MDVRHAQMLFAAAGYYTGAIDGDLGPKTRRAIEIIEANAGADRGSWPERRRMIAAAQTVLAAQGCEPGAIDGYWGHNTEEALTAWLSAQAGQDASVSRDPTGIHEVMPAQHDYPRQRDLAAFYGGAGGPDCTAGWVMLPFAFPLAWDLSSRVSGFACHRRLAAPTTAMFKEAVRHYGEAQFVELELHLFGGCYNFRTVRGGSTLSTHAYGAAIDLNPARNRLRWGADRALFAGPAYGDFFRIAKAHGATPAGHAWGKDWMHFQWARL